MNSETQIMQIIIYAGNAKSIAMTAIREAKNGQIEAAKKKILECRSQIKIAHKYHTEILQSYAGNPEEPTNMFMTHAQDHMMAAMTANDFALEFIDLFEIVGELQTTVKVLTKDREGN